MGVGIGQNTTKALPKNWIVVETNSLKKDKDILTSVFCLQADGESDEDEDVLLPSAQFPYEAMGNG